MILRVLVTVVGYLCLVHVGSAAAQDRNRSLFREANQQYQESGFEAALDSYQKILDSGYESGTLFYNIGNTHFKLGELGRAILNYERAQRLMPRNQDVKANLALSRSLATDEITPLPTFWPLQVLKWWMRLLPISWLALIVGVSYVVAAAAFIVRILTPRARVRSWASRSGVGALVAVVVFGTNLAVIEFGIGVHEEGIVLARSVPVQSAPSDDTSLELFTIHEGTKVRIEQKTDDWLEVVLEDGKVGWVGTQVLGII